MSGFSRVAVVGAGLIGGSVARRLAMLGRDVTVVDPRARGAATYADLAVAGVVPADHDLVVVAVPLDAMRAVLGEVAVQAPGATVLDVGSVKGAVATEAAAAGLAGRYVGTHPMAGTELTGFDHSAADLLVGATWAVVRGAGPVLETATWLVDVFDATVLVTDAEEHDRAVALVSHAPHVLANALLEVVGTAGDPAAAHLAAGSFRDGTRVAGRNASRSANMLTENAAALAPVLDHLLDVLRAYRAELDRPADLLAHLERVVAEGAAVRRPEAAWAPCDDLRAALGRTGPVLVRHRDGRLESAPLVAEAPPHL